MITVTRTASTITLDGHAHYAPQGQDIVCAAVSAMVQNLIQSIEELTTDAIKYNMQLGKVAIEFGNLSEQGKLLVDSFFVGIQAIADEYPSNVRVERRVDK